MEEQDQNSVVNNVLGFSESDAFAISQLKEMLNDVIPTAFPDEEFTPIEVNDAPYDEAFLSVVENYVLNDSLTSDNPDLQALKEQYQTVSEEARTRMESYNEHFMSSDASAEENARQAQSLIHKSQINLGGSHTNTEPAYSAENDAHYAEVDDVTAYVLEQYVERMKQQHPELVDEEFDASNLDGKSLDFINRLVSKRMDEAAVKPENLNTMLIHLWALENEGSDDLSPPQKELAQTASMRDLIGLVVQGKLPNGADVNVSVDDSFTGPVYTGEMTEDRFFSMDTYTALMNDYEVPASTLFAEDAGNPHVEDLKLAAQALGFDTENGSYTQEQVGQIAVRMLEYHACKLGIEKQDITAAINNGEFMPDLDDLRLVEVGLGLPPELQNQNLSGKDAFKAEFQSMGKVSDYRNERWEEEFGAMTEEEISIRIQILHDDRQNDQQLRDQIRDHYTLPTKNYHRPDLGGETKPSFYEVNRANYLEENGDKLKPCVAEVTDNVPGVDNTNEQQAPQSQEQSAFSAAASAPETVTDELSAGIKDATGSDAGTVPEIAPEMVPTTPDQNMQLSAAGQ